MHADIVKLFAGCDEQALHIFAAKAYIRRPRLIDRDIGDLCAGAAKNSNSLSCQVYVAAIIDSHTVRTQSAE